MDVERNILLKVIVKGGLPGIAAELYLNDEKRGRQVIFEFCEQCNERSAQRLWGKKLIQEIRDYCSKG